MEIFNTIQTVLGVALFAGLVINFFYQVIRAFRRIRKTNHSGSTIHNFKCSNCDEVYALNGADLKSRTSIWSMRKDTRTPKSQTTAIRFECPVCNEKAFQEKIYDTDVTAGLGHIRAQFDDSSREVLVELLLKGFLPFFLVVPLLNFFL